MMKRALAMVGLMSALMASLISVGCAIEADGQSEQAKETPDQSEAESTDETNQSLLAGGKWVRFGAESCIDFCGSATCTCVSGLYCPPNPLGKACPTKGRQCYVPSGLRLIEYLCK